MMTPQREIAFGRTAVFVPAEQKRIVARVEALLRQYEALEAQLHQTRTGVKC